MEIDDPTPTQQYILDLLSSEPGMSNADIAEETGTHTALVRDLRRAKRAATDDDTSGPGTLSSRARPLDDLSGTRAAVLQRAAENPELSNAELARAVGTHTALVRDLRSDVQAAVLTHALRNPDATNADIAAELGTPTALVRDARSGLEAEILERSVRNPELSNAALAEELGVTIATVRDARVTYENGIDGVELTPSDDGEWTANGGPTAADTTTAVDGSGGLNSGVVIAVVVGVALVVGLMMLAL